jgi:hypothetical protein
LPPYISKAERERARWITLAKAIDWISEKYNYSRRDATRALRDAIGENVLTLCWEDQLPSTSRTKTTPPVVPAPSSHARVPPTFARPPVVPTLYDPPTDPHFWQTARIRRSRVFDPSANRWRTLLILIDSILLAWPELAESTKAKDGVPKEPAESRKAKGGAPSKKPEIYRALDRLSRQGHRIKTMDTTKLAKLVASECGKQLGEPDGPKGDEGFALRTVQRHIGSYRKEH